MIFRACRPRRGALGLMTISSCPMSEKETSGSTARDDRHIAEDEKATLVRGVFASVAPRYDVMNDLMSAGIHRLWKAEMVAWLKPRPGQQLVDVAGGTGDVALGALPRLVPEGRIVEGGIVGGGAVVCDASERMLEIGRARALDRGILYGIEWVGADAERLPFAERSFDLYTIAFGLRNVTRIDAALAEARRVLKPGGRFVCLEFTPEVGPLLQPLYDLYSFHIVPLLGQMVAGDREAYTYLVESIRGFLRQGELAEMIAAAGLERVKYRNLTGGIAALHSAWRL
jgi:demethylmenaquinone methyltransferase / 2-methoxy-6-polyprenyl-1,4-benzoquinol methylase